MLSFDGNDGETGQNAPAIVGLSMILQLESKFVLKCSKNAYEPNNSPNYVKE